jgi:hypothetical protein
MSLKINVWNDQKFKQEIQKRFRQAQDHRKALEDTWIQNELAVFSTSSSGLTGADMDAFVDNVLVSGDTGQDPGDADMNIAYTFKNFRFLHAQLSANPPSVVMRPTSSDQEDHRKADAADRVIRYAIRKYAMQEKVDRVTLLTLLYGTGIMKIIWNSNLGDIVGYNEENSTVDLEGDIDIRVPFIWNIFLDPDAHAAEEVKWVVERVYMDYEEALAKWPEKEEELKKVKIERESSSPTGSGRRDSALQQQQYNSVELLEYWETGLPSNQYMGRHGITTVAGDVLTPCGPSPVRFPKPGTLAALEENENLTDEQKEERIQRMPQMASLPYHILSDIDVPNSVWGKSAVEYAANIQRQLSRLDTAILDNIQAHGHAKMVVSEGAEVTQDSNSSWEVTEIANNQNAPFYISPPQLMPEMTSTRINYRQGMDDVMGVNEAMFGQQSREQSGASMQYATNQGNMIRRRLFNKYVLFVESIYKSILNNIRKSWSVSRTIRVLGKEKAMESIALKGADIDGGYDVVGEYGVSLSLDPLTRREEILAMQPLFEKAGIPVRMSLKMMKLNELEGMFDKLQLAEDRQREIFEEMAARNIYIAPEEFQDHENMLAWALDYVMTAEFKYLNQETKELIKQHMRDRKALAAQEQAGLTAQPQSPGPAGLPGQLPPQGIAPGQVQPPAELNPIINQ